MRKFWFGLAASGMLALATTANAQIVWQDHFDTYSLGPLAAQSDWEEWYASSNVDADVTQDVSFTGTKSVKIAGAPTYPNSCDVVYPFRLLPGGQPTSGKWLLTARTFVPTGATGVGYFIMMNQYGDPNTDNWSLQVRFNANGNKVKNDSTGGLATDLIRDKWVQFRVFIDLDTDKVDIFYNDVILATGQSWTNGISGGGILQRANLDLFGGNATNAISAWYVEDVVLERGDTYAVVTNGQPNPVVAGNTISLTTLAPVLTNRTAALFVWDVQGVPVIRLLATGSIDLTGKWSISGPVPTGLAGLDINFRSIVIGPSGGTIEGSKELVHFR